MKDIENRQDLEVLLLAFYNSLLQDPAISYVFTEVAGINLREHLPHIVDFWEQSLFYSGSYRKNVMQIHLDLNSKERLTNIHFETWLTHFNSVTNLLFEGPNCEKIKTRAQSIATVMKIKIYGT
jgi:hemoglobin